MLGVVNAIIALGSFIILAAFVYPAVQHIKLWEIPLGAWLLLLACPLYLVQALNFISRSERREEAEAAAGTTAAKEKGE